MTFMSQFELSAQVTQFTLYATRNHRKMSALYHRPTDRILAKLISKMVLLFSVTSTSFRKSSSSQVVSPGQNVLLEMTFPHEGAESPDDPQASQLVQLSSPVKTSATSEPTDILPAAELLYLSRFMKQPERLDL